MAAILPLLLLLELLLRFETVRHTYERVSKNVSFGTAAAVN